MEELLMKLGEYGIVFTLLVAAIFYFLKRENKLETKNSELQTELRETEKENLTNMLKLSALIDKMLEADKVKNEALIKELNNMKESIINKIDSLKND